jgi:hypothetical protein
MSTQYEPPRQDPPLSGWAVSGIVFAATMMMLAGVFHVITGLVAIFDDDFFVATRNYTFDLDVTAWGWIQLVLGLLLFAGGWGLFQRSTWAGVFTIFVASLSAVASFFFIPYYPIWALLVIGIDVWVIWAVTRPSAIRT